MFNVGDVVILKSGGPEMTVEETLEDNVYLCVWFDGKKKVSGTFAGNTIEKI